MVDGLKLYRYRIYIFLLLLFFSNTSRTLRKGPNIQGSFALQAMRISVIRYGLVSHTFLAVSVHIFCAAISAFPVVISSGHGRR